LHITAHLRCAAAHTRLAEPLAFQITSNRLLEGSRR
jgi:hypothetical protein